MNLEDYTPEQQKKARACKTPEELLALSKEEGLELTEAQLQDMAGGWGSYDDCKYYGSRRWCELHSSVFDDNAFCSYGERKE